MGRAVTAWLLSARVVRYEVEPLDGGSPFPAGCFRWSCAHWWVPLMGGHDAKHFRVGISAAYHDSAEALDVDFVTDDDILVDRIESGECVEFSVGTGIRRGNPTMSELFEVTTCIWPSRGKCPGTGVLALRPLRDDEHELAEMLALSSAIPAPVAARQPRRRLFRRPKQVLAPPPAIATSVESRERYGVLREFDPIAYWSARANE